MADKVNILHPRSHEPVDKRGFAAYGHSPHGLREIAGMLRPLDETKKTVVGKSLHSFPPLWCVYFQNVPEGDYTLEVYKQPELFLLDSVSPVVVRPRPATRPEITIMYPLSDATVARSFIASGIISAPSNVSGTMTVNNNTFNGALLHQPTATELYWTLQFLVDSGVGYTLDVWDATGTHANPPSINITVP